MDLNLGDYRMDGYIIDDRMIAEREAEKLIKSISEEERDEILKLPYEEQLKAVDNYMKKLVL